MKFRGGSHCCHCYSSYCCKLKSFPIGNSQLPLLVGALGLCGWVLISILSNFSICKMFTDVEKRGWQFDITGFQAFQIDLEH